VGAGEEAEAEEVKNPTRCSVNGKGPARLEGLAAEPLLGRRARVVRVTFDDLTLLSRPAFLLGREPRPMSRRELTVTFVPSATLPVTEP
jgi:hypothetical protein